MMLFSSLLRNWIRSAPAPRRRTKTSPRQRASVRPRVEALEDRWLPSGLPYPTAATVSQLIADINYADTTGGAFTINLMPSTTFDLKGLNNTTDGANGLPVIGGTKAVDLTITGNGDTIDRVGVLTFKKRSVSNASFRLFDVAPGASLTLDHVTLQGAVGDAIYNQGTLKVIDGIILSGNGGGIDNAGGTVTVSNGTLSSNSGGGIVNAGGTVTVSNSTLSGNFAGYSGGGIYNSGGTVTVSSSTLSGNYATYGGGIYNSGGTVTVSSSTLFGNIADGGGGGGGIYNAGGTVTVSNNSTLSGNYARPDYGNRGGYGGGIYNSGGMVTISNSILSGNAANLGGGIYNDPAGTVTVQNSSRIIGNDSDFIGADVYNLGVLYLDASSIIGTLDGNPAIRI